MGKRLRLQTKITIYICAVVIMALGINYFLVAGSIQESVKERMGKRLLDIGYVISKSDTVIGALEGRVSIDEVQKYVVDIMDVTGSTAIVVADLNVTRFTHPDENLIGQKGETAYEEDIYNANRVYHIDQLGATGVSLKAFTPVYDYEGNHIGVVTVGLIELELEAEIVASQKSLRLATTIGLLISVLMASLLSQNIKKSLFNLEPHEIARILKERTSLLYAVRDGIIGTNVDGEITIVNRSAKRIFKTLDLPKTRIGSSIESVFGDIDLSEIYESKEATYDYEYSVGEERLYFNLIPVVMDDKVSGVLYTFRLKTEVVSFAEELTGVKNYVEALRSQVHEFTNKLHVIFGLVQNKNYFQLEKYMYELVHLKNQEMYNIHNKIKDPIIAAFLLSKYDKSREQDVQFILTDSSDFKVTLNSDVVHDLVTVIGNLLENAFDAVQDSIVKTVTLELVYKTNQIIISVWDSGANIPDELLEQIFDAGFTSKEEGHGIGLFLIKKVVKRYKGSYQVINNEGVGKEFIIQLPYLKGELKHG